MRKALLLSICFILHCTIFIERSFAKEEEPATPPDTVKTGIYVISIHDIDFKENEYTINMWLWLTYKNKKFDFWQNLEIPQAKSFTKSYYTVDTSDGQVYMLMKLQCIMKDSWRINNFPFDRQRLRLGIENSQFDASSLVFAADTLGQHFDPRFTLRGWNIDSFVVSTGIKNYETGFGDPSLEKPHTEYSTFRVRIAIDRSATELFWKMFLGMYVSFLISYMCFYIHADHIDSRFGLSVGALFAAIGNKYVIDSSLPDSSSFTLVDTLHGITLFYIFAVITSSAISLLLTKGKNLKAANKYDLIIAQIMLVSYIGLNIYFITKAING
jgi:hypothetical protein